jgi:hypothetical protein
VAAADPPRVADADLHAAMVAADLEAGMQAAGIWPDRWAAGD